MKILLIEDDRNLSDSICEVLKRRRMDVDAVCDGEDGLAYALCDVYDAVILDVVLPKLHGLKVLEGIRKAGVSVPVLILSQKNDAESRILGLDSGADDYLAKPFIMEELLARLRALTRRKGTYLGDTLSQGNLKLNRDTGELPCSDSSVKLGNKEYQVMEMLLANPKQTIAKDRFVEKIWGYDTEAEYNSVEVYISFLRKKMSKLNSDMAIKTARGRGYLLDKAS